MCGRPTRSLGCSGEAVVAELIGIPSRHRGNAMTHKRIPSIKSSLEFAMDSNRELSQLISEAQRLDGTVKHIGHKAGVVLLATRKCFDYCAVDIRDDYLGDKDKTVYYPFHPYSLGKGKPFYVLQTTATPIYECLLAVSKKIQTGATIKKTMCLYSDAKAVNDLVNAEKHEDVHEICELGRSKSRIEFPNGSVVTATPMYPVGPDGIPDFSQRGEVGPEAWISAPGVKVTAVKDFLFSEDVGMSRRDVHGFCMTAITATRFILGEVYAAAYGVPEDVFLEN